MWPGQTRVPPPAYMAGPAGPAGYQSGQPPLLPDPHWAFQFEQQFSQMSFREPPPQVLRPQRPLQPQNTSPGIPSLLDIRVPRPTHLRSPRPQQQPPQPRNPYPIINTSVPPPRITLLQKPRPPTQPRTPAPTPVVEQPPEAPSEPEVTEVKVEEPPIKVMAILKRPASTPSNLSLSGIEVNSISAEAVDPVESLKKREEEYANLRLRILGSTGAEESS